MEFKSFILLLSLSLLVLNLVSTEARVLANDVLNYQPIKDLKDPHVVDIGKFAVSEHNKSAKEVLYLDEVLSGEEAPDNKEGKYFKLVIRTLMGGKDTITIMDYKVEVFEVPSKSFRELKYFEKLS